MNIKQEIKIEVKCGLGRSYRELWAAGELCCPGCGTKGVWEEQSEGDYYCGPGYLCPKCGASFTIQYSGVTENWQNLQRLEAIRAAIEGRPSNVIQQVKPF